MRSRDIVELIRKKIPEAQTISVRNSGSGLSATVETETTKASCTFAMRRNSDQSDLNCVHKLRRILRGEGRP